MIAMLSTEYVSGLRRADKRLTFYGRRRKRVAGFVEDFLVSVLCVESAYNPCACEIFSRESRHVVEFCLNAFVFRHSQEHNKRKRTGDNESRRNENQREFQVYDHRHDDCAHGNERSTKNETNEHRHALLALIDVGRQSRDERSGGEFVEFGIRERVDVRI